MEDLSWSEGESLTMVDDLGKIEKIPPNTDVSEYLAWRVRGEGRRRPMKKERDVFVFFPQGGRGGLEGLGS